MKIIMRMIADLFFLFLIGFIFLNCMLIGCASAAGCASNGLDLHTEAVVVILSILGALESKFYENI